jgi:dTDP-4-amino-4,6-dideoxygalactose transaminase
MPAAAQPANTPARLAIHGGTPVRSTLLPLSRPWLGEPEVLAAAEAVREGCLVGGGPIGRQVEIALGRLLGGVSPLFVTSCTSALEMAVHLAGAGPGDEVICPSFTFVSTANAVVRAGARPVFVDIDRDTFNIDPAAVQAALGPRTRAVIVVHYGGRVSAMDRLTALADSRGLALIEDAAHALGARSNGRPAGTIGRFGCFSFHGTKDVVCGEGGALVCRDAADRERAELFREKGTNRAAFLRGDVDRYTWTSVGSSFVASDVLAAVLREQLHRLDAIVARKRTLAARLTDALRPLEGAIVLPREWPGIESSWHVYPVLVPGRIRDRALEALRAEGIGASFHYVPLHSSPFARDVLGCRDELPVTDEISASLVRLPLFAAMTDRDLDDVASAALKVFSHLLAS